MSGSGSAGKTCRRRSPVWSGSWTGRRSAPRVADMSEWIYFIHPPRENFAATMTAEEKAVWGVHFERFEQAHAAGTVILVGVSLGAKNMGIAIFEAPDESAARRFMDEDPVLAGG